MKKWMSMMMVMGLLSFVAMGCGGDDNGTDGDQSNGDQSNGDQSTSDQSSQTDSSSTVTLTSLVAEGYADLVMCGDCGHDMPKEDAEDHKCHSGHAACDKCKFSEGTALCCVGITLAETEGNKYCGGCGHVAGSKDCCNPDDTKCAKCGFADGSPLCCMKLKPKG